MGITNYLRKADIMNYEKYGLSVEESSIVSPIVHWEKVFYFDGGNGHRVIYGHHNGGGFIAIPNLHISCEAAEGMSSAEWNRGRMIAAGVEKKYASAIAEYIDEFNASHGAEICAVLGDEGQRLRSYMMSKGYEVSEVSDGSFVCTHYKKG